jgi:hypothetical protein
MGEADKPNGSVARVTPAMAERWLTKNKSNRTVRKNLVDTYAKDMKGGRWGITGSPIQFDVVGDLIDGQHRLKAVIESGTTQQFFVMRKMPTESRMHIDTGAKRTVGDQFTMLGEKNANNLAAACKLALLWETDRMNMAGTKQIVTDTEVREFLDRNMEMREYVEVAMKARNSGLDLPVSVLTTFIWVLVRANHDLELIRVWMEDLATMRTRGAGDPKHAMLSRIQTARRNRERLSQQSVMSMLIRCWNADYRNQKMTKMPTQARGQDVIMPKVVHP